MSSQDNLDDSFYFLPSDSLIIPILNRTGSPSSNIVSSVFNLIFDNLLEGDRFNEAVQNSMDTYNQELFKKTDEYTINLSPESYSENEPKNCFICIENLEGSVYKLECGHIYHQKCLEDAISHQHTRCPVCHKDIPMMQKKIWKKDEYTNNGHKICISSPENE